GLGRQRGVDRHLRFQGLKTRLRHPAARSVLSLLYELRGDHSLDACAYGTDGGRTHFEPALPLLSSKRRPGGFEMESTEAIGPEAKLVRDLLFALQGVTSATSKGESFEIDTVLSRPAWLLCQRVLEIARLHLRLSAAAKDTGGLLHQALCEALRGQLQDYYEVLALLSAEGLSLRSLWARLQAPKSRLLFLSQLCEGARGLFGGALASLVYAFSHSGDTAVRDSAHRILRSVVKPLLAMIRVWMTEGELQDPFGEFFVVADASVPLEDLWNRMYSLELEMVPSFMTLELARKILLTGKSVNFIRLCCPGLTWIPSSGMARWEFGGSDEDLAGPVERAALETNERLVKLLMDHYCLGEHALALRRFLLLGQGDFIESLMDAAQEELNADAKKVHRHQLMAVLDMALRQSNAQFCAADVLARLGVKLLSPSAGERGWDIFLLDYSINSPLHVVFTPAAMQKYDRAFAFLWKLRRVSHALAASWNQQMALQRHLACGLRMSLRGLRSPASPELWLEMRTTLLRTALLRHEIAHLAQNIQSYVMFEVLDTSWAKLQVGWRACTDLDQVILQHERYLAGLEEGAFLARGSEAVLSGVSNLLNLALEFCALQEQACASSFEAAEAMMEVEADVADLFQAARSRPFARSLAECRGQLDTLATAFVQKLQALLRALEEQPERSSDLSFLLCRLDFNTYYEKRAG
ncbi:unnamed protein product, partial [Effrenium voratum]